VIDGDRSVTFAELEQRANRFAAAMTATGLQPGDRVALLVGNRLEWFDATWGLLKAGLVRTYINPRHSAPEISHQIADSQSKVLVVSDDHLPLIKDADLATVGDVLETGPGYEELLARHDASFRTADVADGHPAEIRYTSGTTGVPKGAVHTHGSWMGLLRGTLPHFALRDDDVLLHVGPMSHASGGNCYHFVAVGGQQVIHRGFDPLDVVEAIPRYGITSLLLVPTMIYMLLDLVDEHGIDATSIRTILYGAAPMAPARLERCLQILGPVFMQSYGMSEVLGGMTFLSKEEHILGDERLASCGRPSMVGEVMVADDLGQELPPGEVGEIVMRGPTMMTGYWGRPEATAESLTPQGWFRSNDMARMDERGYIYIVDRKADMIVSGGFNIYPVEVEHVLMAHPAVQEVAVVAVPDDMWGEAVRAVVRLRSSEHADSDDLSRWAHERLAGYKVPKSFEFVTDELPKNPSGKLQRRLIREHYWEGHDRRVG
jgi:acyl-CoA synthetase (AMP-forming)/AMP-acid ligase II